MDRRVALKVLRPEYAGSVSAKRFRREIEIVSRLRHPHIVELYDSGEVGDLPWYSMPFVDGETLKARLAREGALPIGEALRIARAVAEALAHAHAYVDTRGLGVLHRDIKPANILLDGDRVLVVDFGIARAIVRSASDDTLSSEELRIGTAAYMSPEQGGAEKELDGRSDVYSLGIVLYEMLAGETPFKGNTTQAVVARHMLDPVPPLETVRPSVPKSVAEIVYRALAKARRRPVPDGGGVRAGDRRGGEGSAGVGGGEAAAPARRHGDDRPPGAAPGHVGGVGVFRQGRRRPRDRGDG